MYKNKKEKPMSGDVKRQQLFEQIRAVLAANGKSLDE